jgi:putative FmdB family regulatory protein
MPTYQYQCSACKHAFEELQSMKDDPLTKCPKCKKKKLNRLLGTGAGLLFKGSGFYITDYRSESYKSAAKADAPASAKSEGGAAKSDGGSSGGGTAGKAGGAGAAGKSD